MKIALIADLHGNKPATEALERDLQIQKPDLIYCLGDIVGKGPSSDFTFDWALRHSDLILAGNWDIGVGKKLFAQNDHPYFDQLGEERMNKLLTFPIEHEIMMSGRRIRLFHGRPLMKELIMIHHERDLIAPFFFDNQGDAYDVVAYADAHRQGVRTVSMQSMHPQDANSMDRYGQGSHSGIFLNTGSVGNAMGVAKCCYAIIEGEMGEGVGAKDGSQNQKGDSPDISKEKSKAPNEKG
ncbi:MAG: metallophosphoesterase family protein, partial [Clostridiales bacterium]|nr:metallophosphoesterase family protein [Clostridiales bacterium]